jgi:hypothetical protein
VDVERDQADRTEVVVVDRGVVVGSWLLDDPRPGLAAVDHLARLQLAGRRLGVRIRVSHPSAELAALLVAVGLGELVDGC